VAANEDLSKWLSKIQAASFLGVSIRTIDRMRARGEISMAWGRMVGRKPGPLFNPQELERLKASVKIAPAVVNAPPSGAQASQCDQPAVRVRDKVFLTMREASAFSGLPESDLVHLAEAGRLKVVTTSEGDQRISRRSLKLLG
jgi:hypothetical protein